jgi:general secretion pathway protein A
MLVVGGMLLAGAAWWWVSALPTPATADAATGPPPAASSVAIAGGPMAYSDDRQAWTALAARWSLAPTPGEPVCGQVRRVGLVCHEGRGDLALLRQLRRPALLQLHAGGLVLLRDLDDEHAVLDGAPGRHRVPLAQLQAAWSGQFSTLWRPPPGWTEAGVRLSAESAGWVLEQLTALQGAARSGGGRAVTRDELLRQRVFAFQVQQGLDLDGLAGPITLMQLNRASGIDEPQLQPER